MVAVRRGDIAVAALAGDYGKPRPVLIIQNDVLSDAVDSLIVGHSPRVSEAASLLA
jgi:mRNA-degrading endonuclease toxin of MazEF toxin-antitoxin module